MVVGIKLKLQHFSYISLILTNIGVYYSYITTFRIFCSLEYVEQLMKVDQLRYLLHVNQPLFFFKKPTVCSQHAPIDLGYILMYSECLIW